MKREYPFGSLEVFLGIPRDTVSIPGYIVKDPEGYFWVPHTDIPSPTAHGFPYDWLAELRLCWVNTIHCKQDSPFAHALGEGKI